MKFRNLKKTLKRHIKSKHHNDQQELWKANEEKEDKLKSKDETIDMRLA